MEKRVAYSAEDPQLQHLNLKHKSNDDGVSPQLPLPPPPGHPLSSFVVQVPKNQIYRVPPPENAQIQEKYRMAAKKRKRKLPCLNYFICFLLVLLVIGLIIGTAILVVYFCFSPKGPVFSISSLVVKQQKGSPPTYNVKLKIKNPNEKMGITYTSEEDDLKLTYWKKTLGWGEFPSLEQKKGNSNEVNIKVNGVKDKPLPQNVKKSMSGKRPISLAMNIETPLVFNVWILKMWRRNIEVKCKFRVSTMGEGTKIVSQVCNTKLA
ncbi:hypothetical protein Golax_005404 [Gossypium laxum]|uniref:Late embryogenesis abundant protein LEA-2 subgroup domain-containing protein n=1 Tax=Gossypium laxum TaxID=34288 RepID=A0A7J9A0N4_9ROSI|nr:hypothetical protein [Gossypium laxum]